MSKPREGKAGPTSEELEGPALEGLRHLRAYLKGGVDREAADAGLRALNAYVRQREREVNEMRSPAERARLLKQEVDRAKKG